MSKFERYSKDEQDKVEEAKRQLNQRSGGAPGTLPKADMTLSEDSPSEEDLDNPGKGENRGR